MKPQPRMSNIPVFPFRRPSVGTCLPTMAQQTSQTPKWLDEGRQSGAVYSNLVI